MPDTDSIPQPSPLPDPTGLSIAGAGRPRTGHELTLEREINQLKSMVMAEGATAVGMVEQAAEALVKLDENLARLVISRDDEIDKDEVRIEEECFRVLALFHPFARDFRQITTLLKVNADLERMADHATSVAKQAIKLKDLGSPARPTPLIELAQRVPMVCHAMLKAMASEDEAAARDVVARDKAIDTLEKQLFEECIGMMTHDRASKAACLIYHRCGRELERIGDLMKNVAEDVIYLRSGTIVRHEKKRA